MGADIQTRAFLIATAAAVTASAGVSPAATLSTLVNFSGANGSNPQAGLIVDLAGNLYGTTAVGGANNLGTVFRLNAANNYSLSTLASFNAPNGRGPFAGLVADAAGNLYGTTNSGGPNGAGTVFRLDGAGFLPEPVTRGGGMTATGALTTLNGSATPLKFTAGFDLPLPVIGTPTGTAIARGSIPTVRRAPAGVTGDYLSIGFGAITFDFIDAAKYVGLYAGSPDEYNFIEFFADSGLDGVPGAAVDVPGFGTLIDGREVANIFGAPLYRNEYWNFSFSALQDVRYMRLSSTNTAFEIGEIAVAYFGNDAVALTVQQQVPAPGALTLLGLGAAGLVARRRG